MTNTDKPDKPTAPAPRTPAVGYVAGDPHAGTPADATTENSRRESRGEAVLRGSHPGDRYVVKVVRSTVPDRLRPGAVVPARDPGPPRTALGHVYRRLKRLVIGAPLASQQVVHERLTKIKALAILSSDALSSVAYATEQTLLILVLVGTGALALDLSIGAAITLLLAIVVISYRQTIFAYPSGGGSYIVASDNLGPLPGLTAAAALLIDYVLTVAVSISAGVIALTSAAPSLAPYRVTLGLVFMLLLMLGNLRGIRESGTIFAAPTYLFIGSMLIMLGVGFVRAFVLHDPAATGVPRPFNPADFGVPKALGPFLVLQAFSSGCSAMTGTEAISNGVPAFEKPESKNAATTLVWMALLLGTMVLGTTILVHQYGLVPDPSGNPSLLSQLTVQVVGHGAFHWFYYVLQGATLLVLVLAANTSYADFPRLASILARDRYAPRLFGFRGDRLAFTVGIFFLSVCAALLLLIFNGDTTALIPLYAVGVFISFTLSQAGMVVHWRRERGRRWAVKAAINGLGAIATAIVAFIAGATKLISGEPLFRAFGHNIHAGSWIVLVLIPVLIVGMQGIHRHYGDVARQLAAGDAVVAETPLSPAAIRHLVVVPIAALNRVALQTLAYACSITPHVIAIHVADDPDAIGGLQETWQRLQEQVPFLRGVELVLIESPYRALAQPLLRYIDELDARDPHDTLTIILPEFVPVHWWEHLLHNQTALRLKAALLFRPGTVVTSVPYHLRRGAHAKDPPRTAQS